MCIRDSFQVTWLSGTDAAAVDSWLTAQGYPTRTALIPTFPVSYTHLRAHETVLDLVCRLLLEKKTTTHTDRYERYD